VARRPDARLIGGVGKKQLSIVGDHHAMRDARLEVSDGGGVAKGSDELLEYAARIGYV
jgi:hypothetical protein